MATTDTLFSDEIGGLDAKSPGQVAARARWRAYYRLGGSRQSQRRCPHCRDTNRIWNKLCKETPLRSRPFPSPKPVPVARPTPALKRPERMKLWPNSYCQFFFVFLFFFDRKRLPGAHFHGPEAIELLCVARRGRGNGR